LLFCGFGQTCRSAVLPLVVKKAMYGISAPMPCAANKTFIMYYFEIINVVP
jgi:hypothetical protein